MYNDDYQARDARGVVCRVRFSARKKKVGLTPGYTKFHFPPQTPCPLLAHILRIGGVFENKALRRYLKVSVLINQPRSHFFVNQMCVFVSPCLRFVKTKYFFANRVCSNFANKA